jgi:hypothetical protein
MGNVRQTWGESYLVGQEPWVPHHLMVDYEAIAQAREEAIEQENTIDDNGG